MTGLLHDLIHENTPDGGEWAILCACGEPLIFAYRDRGSARCTLLVTHGEGEARWELPGYSEDNLLWMCGLADPLVDWLDTVHRYEEDCDGLG